MSGRRAIFTICLEPAVSRALTHYIRATVAGDRDLPPRFGKSTAINGLLRRGLRREGFDPDHLRLLGESAR